MRPVSLELCCGTQSFTKVMKRVYPNHHSHISVDNDSSCRPTYACDILEFDYASLISPSQCIVTHIWCSPPCTQYSNMRTTGPARDLLSADRIVERCLTIVRYYLEYNPNLLWFMENPKTGLLKTRQCVCHLPFYDVTYCRYAPEWGMRKSTRIWTNRRGFVPKVCLGRECAAVAIDTKTGRYRHTGTVCGKFWKKGVWKSKKHKQREMGRVPHRLILELLQ
jgi:hypothetical protein